MGRELDFEDLRTGMGTQRNRAHPRRMEGSRVSGRRRRPVHRSRPGLSEQAHLLVQSLPGKKLRRPALRSDSRRDRRRRRPRVDRRGQSAANRDDAGGARRRAASPATCSRSSAKESSRCWCERAQVRRPRRRAVQALLSPPRARHAAVGHSARRAGQARRRAQAGARARSSTRRSASSCSSSRNCARRAASSSKTARWSA